MAPGAQMRRLALLAAFLLIIGCVMPFALADDDSLKVIVILEDKTYSVGSPVKVTVHVFDKAKHVDADNVPSVVTGYYPTRAVSVSRTSTGVYEGTFTLQSSDLSSGFGRVSATATYGQSDGNDTTYNEAEGSAMISTGAGTSTGLSVQCLVKSISTDIVKPGTKITVEAVVKHNGTAVVPSDFSITLSYQQRGGGSHTEKLTTTNPAVGTYECEYTVPELTFDTDLEFDAEAQYSQDADSDSASVSLDFFQVIYHNISKKATEAVFDMFIADLSGEPVGGATLSVTYGQDGLSRSKTLDAGVTDSSGKARVTLSCDNGTSELDVRGYANASGKSQSFTGTIGIPSGPEQAPSPSGNDFEAVYVGKDMVYKAGQTVSRDFVIFNNSKLWANKEIYCYIQSGKFSTTTYSYVMTSVDARTMTTDADGKLRLTVPAPANQETFFEVDFVTATGVHQKPGGYYGSDHDSVDGALYSEDSDSFMSQKSALAGAVKVTVQKLNIGSPTSVGAEAKSGDPSMAQVGWIPGEIDDIYTALTGDRDWNVWSGTATYMAKKGSSYSGTVTIPSFMPKDRKYSIVVVKAGVDFTPENYGIATVSPGQSSAPVKSEFPWMAVGAAIVVLVVVVAAVAFIMMRKKRAGHPGAPPYQQAPYQQAPGYQPPPPATGAPGPAAPSPMAPPPAGYQQPPPAPAAQPMTGYQQPPPAAVAAAQPQAPQTQPAYAPPPVPPAAAPPQATATPPPNPIPPPPPSVTGPVAMPNNGICAFCNQWILQGSPGILCSCGKYYHEPCAKIQLQCSNCGKVL